MTWFDSHVLINGMNALRMNGAGCRTVPKGRHYRKSDYTCMPPATSQRRRRPSSRSNHQELYSGFIRLHILYHASKGSIFGLEIMRELARHGYDLGPGTLYPILHGLEKRGYLRSAIKQNGRSRRRLYRATAAGVRALIAAKEKAQELVGELFEDE